MRTTITLQDSLLETAKKYSGLTKISEIIDLALMSYNTQQASRRLAALGGSDPFAETAPRNRLDDESPSPHLVAEKSLFDSPSRPES